DRSLVSTGSRLLSRSEWSSLGAWWLDELAGDPAYEEEVLPLALDLLAPQPGSTYLDLGCGEGRLMAALESRGARSIGVDVAPDLLDRAAAFGEIHRTEAPPIPLAPNSVEGVAIVLTLEHIRDEEEVLAE